MTTRLKIGVCVNHYHPSVGGAEIVAQNISEYLAKHHDVFIFTRKLSKKTRDFQNYNYTIFEYTNVVGFEKQIEKLSLDVVLVYSDMFDFFRPLIIKKSSYKLILALCGANWLYSHRNYINTLYRNRQHIHSFICHSKCELDYKICLSEKFIDKTVVIPNGVWTEEFDTNNLTRQDLSPNLANRRWILNVSNFFPGKGQEHLVKIISKLPESDEIAYIQVSSTIDFVIGEALENRWKVACRSLKNKGVAVKLFKNIEREKVIGFLKQSNVFAFTSEKEVAPLVLLESMAASLPWVASNVGNAIDLKGGRCVSTVKDSQSHNVFNDRTYKGFIEAMPDLWNNPSIGEEGRKQIDNELNWDKILPQYLELIES